MPRMPGCSASHSISATERSTLWVMGTERDAAVTLRAAAAHFGQEAVVRPRPAKASSGSAMEPAESPAPKGGEAMPVMASASANMTSAVTPSASSSLSRWSMSQAPRRPSSLSVSQPMM